MGRFGNIGSAKSSQGGVYLLPGKYALECKANKTGITRDKREFFVAEFTILESSNPDRPVGTSVSFMVMLDKNIETALGNIKGYVAGLFDIPEQEVDEAGVETLVTAANPGAGMKVRCEAANIKTRANKDFTKVTWETYKTTV
jgi:hypothetical protein